LLVIDSLLGAVDSEFIANEFEIGTHSKKLSSKYLWGSSH